MCSRPSASTATSPRCRCWPRRRRSPADYGPMYATIARSVVRPNRRRSSSTRATAAASTRVGISRAMPPRDRGGEHPCRHLAGYAGILQADTYAGFNELYHEGRKPGPIVEAACWAHGRRKLFVLADVGKAPLAIEAVRRIDAIFAVERDINGLAAEQRRALRQVRAAPLVGALETWMRAERGKMSRHAGVAKAMDYMLKRWVAFTRFLDDGRICLTNNAAERALRGIAIGRKAWLFAGSDRGGERAAAMNSLIATAKLN